MNTPRVLAAAAALVALAACGKATVARQPAVPGGVAAVPTPSTTAAPAATATPAIAPTPSTSHPAMPVAATTHPAPPVTMRPSMVTTVPIQTPVRGGACGTVTVTPTASGALLNVVITGLVPGSLHTVHDHLGFCGAAQVSTHLAVLTVAAASPSGVIAFTAAVPASEAGPSRILIVYTTATPAVIGGCASI